MRVVLRNWVLAAIAVFEIVLGAAAVLAAVFVLPDVAVAVPWWVHVAVSATAGVALGTGLRDLWELRRIRLGQPGAPGLSWEQ